MSTSYKYQDNNHLQQQRSMFLPIMLCSRSSLKGVRISHRRASSDDSSPTGQVKRNNKVTGFPTGSSHRHPPGRINFSPDSAIQADRKASAAVINRLSYQKLKRFFSSKSLNGSPTATCNMRSNCEGGNSSNLRAGRDLRPVINLAELDPPLPVLRVAAPPPEMVQGRERDNLWKRRSGATTLKTVKITEA